MAIDATRPAETTITNSLKCWCRYFCAVTLMFDNVTAPPSTNFLFFINRLETFQTVGIQVQRQSIASPARRVQPRGRSFGRGADAISAISLLMIAWPNELKSCASTTNAPGPPITLSRKYLVSPPGGLVCSGFHGSGVALRITSPLIVMLSATAASRASRTSRPELLVPSPDTSMVRRLDSNGALANRPTEKSIPALI